MTPLLGVLIGAAATLLSIVAAVAIVVHRRNNLKRRRRGQEETGAHPAGNQASNGVSAANQQGQQTVLPNAHTTSTGNGNSSANGAGLAADGQLRSAPSKDLGNGYLAQHFAKLNSTGDQHVHKDPDIILRDMGILKPMAKPNGHAAYRD